MSPIFGCGKRPSERTGRIAAYFCIGSRNHSNSAQNLQIAFKTRELTGNFVDFSASYNQQSTCCCFAWDSKKQQGTNQGASSTNYLPSILAIFSTSTRQE